MKKILLITRGYPLEGTEGVFLEEEFRILKANTQLYVLAITNTDTNKIDSNIIIVHPPKLNKFKLLLQLRYREVRNDIDIVLRLSYTNVMNRLFRVKNILFYSLHSENYEKIIEEYINKFSIDIVYTYWCLPATVASLRLKNKYSIKVVTRFHGLDLYHERALDGWQPLRGYITSNADLLVFACQNAKKYYMTTFGKCCDNSMVSYIGTKKRFYLKPIKHDGIIIISCSSVIPLKRVDLIAKSILLISKKIKVEWHHIGGPIVNYEFLDEAGVDYNIYGWVDNEKIDQLYKEIYPDIFITLSSTEGGAPISIQEAFSMGIPAVGTDVGGIADLIIPGQTGYLIDKDTDELSVMNTILKYYELDYDEKLQISRNAYEIWKQKFESNSNAKRFINILVNSL